MAGSCNVMWTIAILVAFMCVLPTPISSSPESPPLKSHITGKTYLYFNCTFCQITVTAIKTLTTLHVSDGFITRAILTICERFHIEDDTVCHGLIESFKLNFVNWYMTQDEVITAVRGTDFSASDTCVMMFGTVCAKSAFNPEIEWHVKIPGSPKPPPHDWPEPHPDSPKLRVLHLSDIHVDLKYQPGSNANCNEPMCCRESSSPRPVQKKDEAGYWGDYRYCDIPEWTLDNMFNHIAKHEKLDMIYWTGDLPAHDVWEQTREDQVSLLFKLAEKFTKYFPNIPIYSSVGNHESAPVDSFPPPFITGNQSEAWLYKVLAKTWTNWLPRSTISTIQYGGFYTTLVRPGFRIVSINTNYCDHRNWWLMLNVTDPAQELQWLVGILQSAEKVNEKVHILGHIPPGDSDCYRVWSTNYHNIVVRYSNTIAGQFFGHTHYDQFELFYDPTTSRPVAVGYVTPAVTTYREMNPAYRMYTIDGFYTNSSWVALDHETTIMNITAANLYNDTAWFKEYSAKSTYNMSNLSPPSWHNLARLMHSNDQLFQRFYRYYYKLNTPSADCDTFCKDAMLCDLHMSIFGNSTYCDLKASTSAKDILERLVASKLC